MRPYVIVTGDFVRTGGQDCANWALASHLVRGGRTVHLVAHRVADDLVISPNVVFHRVPRPGNAHALGAPLLTGAGLSWGAWSACRGGRVVVNGGNCPFPAANWVHYVHAAYETIASRRSWRSAKARALHRANMLTERAALRLAKVIVTNSERTRRDVVDLIGVPEDRVHRVYLGIDSTRFRPPSGDERSIARVRIGWPDARPRVVFVGALGDSRKGFDVVYEAWRILAAKPGWDAELVVLGTGAELAHWRARAESDGMRKHVTFLGFSNDVPRILAACDALVAPSRYESYGLGVHEALCCGLPAFVSATAGVAERYPRALRGLLLEDPESPSAVAASLMQWRERSSEWRAEMRTFSEQLRARSWDDMARDMVALCDASA
jgi:glycosyltransferase involved in cell wall biosynthesis